MRTLSSTLIDNDEFVRHVSSRYSGVCCNTGCLDISPYRYLVDVAVSKEQRRVFYLYLNYFLEGTDKDIKGGEDVSTPLLALCYIYLAQYHFL